MPIVNYVGSPGTVGPASGGKTWAINNLGTTPVQVVGPNPARTGLTFHNPGAAIDIYIYPLVAGDGTPLTPSVTLLGGTFRVFPGGTIVVTGEIQTGWGAFALSGTSNSLTVMDTNIG